MLKKVLASTVSAAILFGAAAVLPAEYSGEPAFGITASAEEDKTYTSGDYKYQKNDDGITLTDYTGKSTDLVIPSKLDGQTVTSMNFFNPDVQLKSVVIPDTVKSMCGCFENSYPSLKKVVLGESMYNITQCFEGCTALTSLNIPDSMYYFQIAPPYVKEYTVTSKNKRYVAVDGVILNKEKTCILFYPMAKKSYTVPKTVKNIGYSASSDVGLVYNSLTDLTFEDGCTSVVFESVFSELVGIMPFDNIQDAECSVTIPASVKSIPDGFGYYTKFGDEGNPEQTLPCKGLTIRGVKGSAAETYAKKNGFKFAELGNFSDCKVTIPYASYTYRGRGIKPTVTVKDANGNKLVKGTDYTVSYSNNTNVGTAAITVTGKGNYKGTLKKTFKVKALDLSSSYAKVTIPYCSYTYTGSAVKPKVTVKFKDGSVIPESEYTVSYSGNVKVGNAAITVKGKGSDVTGNYRKTFVVKPEKNEITSITANKGSFRITWKKATAGAVGYQVLYSRDKAALESAVGEVSSTNAAKYVHSYTSADLSDLTENFSKHPNSGETWYVKIRSFVTKDGKTTSTRYGNYSAVKSIKVN